MKIQRLSKEALSEIKEMYKKQREIVYTVKDVVYNKHISNICLNKSTHHTNKCKYWTEIEDVFIKNSVKNKTPQIQIAKELNRTLWAIRTRIYNLNRKKL
jgi:hypothetical protein